jgi:hypothetical protein
MGYSDYREKFRAIKRSYLRGKGMSYMVDLGVV